ncbi:hypothetical protein NP493_1070g00052, partial [Ridgeia piscesae]
DVLSVVESTQRKTPRRLQDSLLHHPASVDDLELVGNSLVTCSLTRTLGCSRLTWMTTAMFITVKYAVLQPVLCVLLFDANKEIYRAYKRETVNHDIIDLSVSDEQSHVFNPNCRNEILLMGIKKACHLPRADMLELSDETGMVKHLHSHLKDYGTTHFKDRETLVLLRVEQKINPKFLKPDDRLLKDRKHPRRPSASLSSVTSAKRQPSRRPSKQPTPRK